MAKPKPKKPTAKKPKRDPRQPVKTIDVKLAVHVVHERHDNGMYSATWEVAGWPGASEKDLRRAASDGSTGIGIYAPEGAEVTCFVTAKVPVPPIQPSKTVKGRVTKTVKRTVKRRAGR